MAGDSESVNSTAGFVVGTSRKEFPKWASKPFMDFLDFVENMREVHQASAASMGIMIGFPKMWEAAPPETEKQHQQYAMVRKIAGIAKREVERGFPLLHSQVTVALWSGLESLAWNVVVAFLLNDRARVLAHASVRGLKVPLSEYGQLSFEQQAEYLAELIDKTTTAPLKDGATRFDALLDVVGIVTPLEENIRRALFEMGQVRNVIVHRGSVVDRRLAENCPWLTLKPGVPLVLARDAVQSYFDAAIEFCGARLWATRRSLGVPDPEPDTSET